MSEVRLIDANALLEKAEVVMDEHKTMYFDAVSVNNIHNAPTIEPKQEWIPFMHCARLRVMPMMKLRG